MTAYGFLYPRQAQSGMRVIVSYSLLHVLLHFLYIWAESPNFRFPFSDVVTDVASHYLEAPLPLSLLVTLQIITQTTSI
jgi:hypothetical protein